jgi:hypothetical protein
MNLLTAERRFVVLNERASRAGVLQLEVGVGSRNKDSKVGKDGRKAHCFWSRLVGLG